jgi:hypothetical protein
MKTYLLGVLALALFGLLFHAVYRLRRDLRELGVSGKRPNYSPAEIVRVFRRAFRLSRRTLLMERSQRDEGRSM